MYWGFGYMATCHWIVISCKHDDVVWLLCWIFSPMDDQKKIRNTSPFSLQIKSGHFSRPFHISSKMNLLISKTNNLFLDLIGCHSSRLSSNNCHLIFTKSDLIMLHTCSFYHVCHALTKIYSTLLEIRTTRAVGSM